MTNEQSIQQHIAFIMDGNRRWAKKRFLPIEAGHSEGAKRIEPLVEQAAKKGIKYLTFYSFSTENWNRGEEVGTLLSVFRRVLKDPMIDRLRENGVAVKIIGDLSAFPDDIKERVQVIIDESAHNDRITANFALNYGGRDEILRAINTVILSRAKDLKSLGKDSLPAVQDETRGFQINEETLGQYLYTAGQPDPDFIIRTGGEQRLSNFLTWQSVYSELYFTDTLWPDFKEAEFDKALEEFADRERRFGK